MSPAKAKILKPNKKCKSCQVVFAQKYYTQTYCSPCKTRLARERSKRATDIRMELKRQSQNRYFGLE